MENRFPIFDVSPRVQFGDELVPVKAIADEAINVRATVVREGHDGLWEENQEPILMCLLVQE